MLMVLTLLLLYFIVLLAVIVGVTLRAKKCKEFQLTF